MIFSICVLIAFSCIALFSIYMLNRNEKVADFRRKVLFESEYNAVTRQFIPYAEMVDYATMMRKFWVWPLENFKFNTITERVDGRVV